MDKKQLAKAVFLAALTSLVAALVTYYVTSYLNRKREVNNYKQLQSDKELEKLAAANAAKSDCKCGQH